jgi:hypothetical protein
MSQLEFFDAFDATRKANVLSRLLLRGPAGPALAFAPRKRPVSDLICGVGVAYDQATRSVTPILLKDAGDSQPQFDLLPIGEADDVRAELESILPGYVEDWTDTFVTSVRTPRSYAATGDTVRTTKRGIAGTKVTWGGPPNLDSGLLTAGHVVGSSTSATVGGATGTIAFANTYVGSGVTPKADVAVIELANPPATSSITKASTPSALDWVNILTFGGPKATQVIGKLIWLFFPADNGTAGELYFTYPGVTIPGDSGAAAVLQSSRHEVVGHVIGGSGSSADYVQDVRYQLKAITLAGVTI